MDDASDQDVGAYAETIDDGRLRYFRNERNGGLAFSRNVGIRAAIYPYIAFCDDDDAVRPEKIEKQLRALLEAGEKAGFAYCEMHYHRLLKEKDLYIPNRDIPAVRKSGYIYPELLRRNYIGGSSMLIKRSCFEKVGYFDETLSVFEDWDMVLRLAKEYEAVFVPEPLYDYYEREKSMTTRRDEDYYARIRTSLSDLNDKINTERKKYGLDFGDIWG